jgi:hypothetical protein
MTYEYALITKEEFINQNPFGTISKQNPDGSTTLLSQQEYDSWVEFSRGIWGQNAVSLVPLEDKNGNGIPDSEE